jgi:hypothetical protein
VDGGFLPATPALTEQAAVTDRQEPVTNRYGPDTIMTVAGGENPDT